MSSNKNRPSPPRLIVNPPSPDFQSQFQSPGLFSSSSSSASATWSLSTATTVTPTTQLPQPQTQPQPQPKPTLTIETLLAHLRTPLHPLVSSITGLQHPYFPRTLLSYHLLTSHQLDDLARHYHQVWPPVPGTFWYPTSIPAWVGHDGRECGNGNGNGNGVDLATKRRRFGRFIGLRGCESPVDAGEKENGNGNEQGEEMVKRMEMEWQMALERAVRIRGRL